MHLRAIIIPQLVSFRFLRYHIAMKITVVTMFPELFDSFLSGPLIARSLEKKLAEIRIVDIKEYADGSFRHIDDSPFGGGAGMILRCEPVIRALRDVRSEDSHTILFSPAGNAYSQKKAHELADMPDLVLLCGHYEGIDARAEEEADELLSIGDYVLSGGEIPAMAVIDSIIRLKEGIIRSASTEDETFETGLLEYPQYTKPRDFEGKTVPEVLLSGNHEKIRLWKRKESLRRTLRNRPDLLENFAWSEEDRKLLEEIKEEQN